MPRARTLTASAAARSDERQQGPPTAQLQGMIFEKTSCGLARERATPGCQQLQSLCRLLVIERVSCSNHSRARYDCQCDDRPRPGVCGERGAWRFRRWHAKSGNPPALSNAYQRWLSTCRSKLNLVARLALHHEGRFDSMRGTATSATRAVLAATAISSIDSSVMPQRPGS